MDKEWRQVPSLNGRYEVSEDGQVKNHETQKVLKSFISKFGYLMLTVRPMPKQVKTVRVHQQVAEAFIGPRPEGKVINHIDGNKLNNHYTNLEYVTSSENNIHALKNGLRHPAKMKDKSPRGEQHYKSSVTEKQVIEILLYHYRTGEGARKIAKRFGISRGTAAGIISEKRPRWTHIDREPIKQQVLKEKGESK